MDKGELKCPRCGEVNPIDDPDPEVPEYTVDACDRCTLEMLDERTYDPTVDSAGYDGVDDE